MSNQSEDDLMSWFRGKPQSCGWNAIVAYDRGNVNRILAQEYIARFSTDSYLKPLTARIPVSQEENEYVFDFVLDHPRLSFENATVQWSLARLAVKVVGGTHLTTRVPPGQPEQIFKVASYDILNGPEVRMGISLSVLLGSADIQGRIVVDLSKGTEITLTFDADREKRRIAGEFFRSYFEQLPDEEKVFILSEIGSSEGQYLKPRNVQIRTQAAPGSHVRNTESYGTGAVLMFITMEGEEYGTFPATDEDMRYLIPDEPAGRYSTTLLLGNEFFIRKFVEEGCRRMTQTPEQFSFTIQLSSAGLVEQMAVTHGDRTGPTMSRSLEHFPNVTLSGLETPMAEPSGKASFTLNLEGDAITLNWQGEKAQTISLTTRQGHTYTHDLPSFWRFKKRYVFNVSTDSGEMAWASASGGDHLYYKVSPGSYATVPEVADHFTELSEYVEAQLYEQLQLSFDNFVSPLVTLNIFRLNNILFRNDHFMQSVSANLPGDLVVFGKLSPGLTAFTVDPVEYLLGPGGTLQFTTTPSLSMLSWTVENIPGSTADPGSIDPATGVYKAPALEAIKGFFTRVRVTASKGPNSSSALLTVLARAVTFNPLVVVCGVDSSCEMAASSRDDNPLEWSIAGPDTGSKIEPSTLEDGDHTYFAPPRQETVTSTFSLEEVQVRDTITSSVYSSYVLVVHRPVNAFISIDTQAGLPEGNIQLQVDLGEGPIELECVWTLLQGSGKIDANGVFTVDGDGHHKFALITARISPPEVWLPAFEGFIIIPLPLVEWQQFEEVINY